MRGFLWEGTGILFESSMGKRVRILSVGNVSCHAKMGRNVNQNQFPAECTPLIGLCLWCRQDNAYGDVCGFRCIGTSRRDWRLRTSRCHRSSRISRPARWAGRTWTSRLDWTIWTNWLTWYEHRSVSFIIRCSLTQYCTSHCNGSVTAGRAF